MNSSLSDRDYARNVARYLLSSFPQQAQDPEVYGEQLTILLTGRPKALLQSLVNPVDGLLGKTKFLPTLAEVRKWLESTPAPSRVLPGLPGGAPLNGEGQGENRQPRWTEVKWWYREKHGFNSQAALNAYCSDLVAGVVSERVNSSPASGDSLGDSPEEKRAASRRFWSELRAKYQKLLARDPDNAVYKAKIAKAEWYLANYDRAVAGVSWQDNQEVENTAFARWEETKRQADLVAKANPSWDDASFLTAEEKAAIDAFVEEGKDGDQMVRRDVQGQEGMAGRKEP